MSMEVRTEPQRDGRVVARIRGELDLSTRDAVVEALRGILASGARAVTVDLSATRFLDAVGVGALIRAWSLARDAGRILTVQGARGMVGTVLRITRADEILCGATPAVTAVDGGEDPAARGQPDAPG